MGGALGGPVLGGLGSSWQDLLNKFHEMKFLKADEDSLVIKVATFYPFATVSQWD